MPFTSLDSLASVVAAGASISVVFTVWLSMMAAWAFVPAGLVPDLGPQGVLDRLPRAIATPLPIVVMDRSPWGKVVGKHPPLDAAADEIEDGVEDFGGRRTAAALPVWAWKSGAGPASTGHRSDRRGICVSYPFYAQNKG